MNPLDLPWTNLRDSLRMHPGGPSFAQFRAGTRELESA